MRLEGWHLLIIIVLALVLFAAPKLPSMARSLGQSMRIFKSEVREMKKDGSESAKTDADKDTVEGTVVTHPEASKKDGEAGPGKEFPPSNRT